MTTLSTDSQDSCSQSLYSNMSNETLFGNIVTPRPDSSGYRNNNLEDIDREPSTVEVFGDWEVGSRYKLVRVLGNGSYGEVVEALDNRTGAKVAIKRIQNIFEQPIDAKRIYREMYILRHMNHPHIIRLLNVVAPHLEEGYKNNTHSGRNGLLLPGNGKTKAINNAYENNTAKHVDHVNLNLFAPNASKKRNRRQKTSDDRILDDIYLVFEFVDTDLYKLILSPQYLSTAHIQTFLYQILLSLKYLQSAHVIHRDLKPANILVNEDCSLKVCDFGLARVVGVESMTPQTEENGGGVEQGSSKPKPLTRSLTRHVVTRWYRAPELILLQEYTSAVDMWSLGCVLGELLSMQAESVRDHEERLPLFPGRSCPSLSGDGLKRLEDGKPMETKVDRMDQLTVICDVLGSPTAEDVTSISDPFVLTYLRTLPPKKPRSLSSIYPGADPLAIDLLQSMLTFNPQRRISVEDALAHPFLQNIRRPNAEIEAAKPLSLWMENAGETIMDLKALIIREILHYREDGMQLSEALAILRSQSNGEYPLDGDAPEPTSQSIDDEDKKQAQELERLQRSHPLPVPSHGPPLVEE